jgi:hypothetical protein
LDRSGCKVLLLCADDEYISEEVCKKCDNSSSFILVALSFLSFVVVTW